MRHFLPLIAFSLAVAALVLVPQEAAAGESYLGTVVNTDAGTGVSNLTTAAPFIAAPGNLLTVQPSANAYVCINATTTLDAGLLLPDGGLNQWVQYRVPTCTSAIGVRIDANVAFPTSCGGGAQVALTDGGTGTRCVVSCLPVSGASVSCPTWLRLGDEL